jgi:hypothetical protein
MALLHGISLVNTNSVAPKVSMLIKSIILVGIPLSLLKYVFAISTNLKAFVIDKNKETLFRIPPDI